MKKIILIITLLTLTGCQTKDFQKTCTLETKSRDIVDKEIKEINFNNKDEITKVTIIKNYTLTSDNKNTLENIKESTENYNNALLKQEGIKISISKDEEKEYEIKYYLDVKKMEEQNIERFNLHKNSIKFFNKMQSKDIKCK